MGDTDLLASAESLAPGVWQRLQTIRKRYDPDGAF
jgi:FAD/FMN-containing dehydrogenase